MYKSLQLIFHRLLEDVSLKHYRFLYPQFKLTSRITGLIGARGVGKTTLLLQTIKNQFLNQPVFYFSADHLYFETTTLYAFIEELYLNEGIAVFFIDEIHKYKNWIQELKNIYDGFPAIKIVFSGSSSLDLTKGSYDLSRRAKLYYLPGMSFREYLNFNTNDTFETISFTDLIQHHQKYDSVLANIKRVKGHFNDYIRHGYYPFVKEDPLNFYEKILRVIDKTIYEDIANFYNFRTSNLHQLKKLLIFMTTMPPGNISVHNIAKNLGVDDKTIINYLISLNETGLINLIFPAEIGNSLLRRPEKFFLNNTNLQFAIEGIVSGKVELGTIRELFFVQSILNAGLQIFHSKVGDYLVEDFIFEVGGKNKTRQQIKNNNQAFLVKDDILISGKSEIPLFYFGFIY